MAFGKTPYPHWAGSYVPMLYPGRHLFVSSTAVNASDGNLGDSPERPLATLEGAFNSADLTADNGDVIHLMPNHAETITGAGGITADIAGVTVIGYGSYNQRPRFLMDGANTVDLAVSAADITFRNMVFVGGHSDIVRCFNITAVGCWLDMVEFSDNAVNEQWLTPVKATSTSDNNADGLKLTGCRWISIDTGSLEMVEINADLNDFVMTDCVSINDLAAGATLVLVAAGKDLRHMVFMRNVMISGNTSTDKLINNDTAVNTGVAAYNLAGHHDATASITIDCDGIRQFENYSCGLDTASGLILPVRDDDT